MRIPLFHPCVFVFFFNDTATTEIYTLSLHDALPISVQKRAHHIDAERELMRAANHGQVVVGAEVGDEDVEVRGKAGAEDRKSTRLNSSHSQISYAVFCLKKKKNYNHNTYM